MLTIFNAVRNSIERQPFVQPNWLFQSQNGKALLVFLTGLLVFIAILLIPVQHPISPIFLVRYNLSIILILYFGIIYFTYLIPGWLGRLFSFSATMALFSLSLSYLWTSGVGDYYAISGLIPWSDARSYYVDALRLVEGYHFSSFSAWRPLFPGFASFILSITNQNLQITVTIFVMLAAIACYLFTREVQRYLGTAVSIFVFAILFIFYRRYSGLFTAENLGFTFGVLGFVFLLRGARGLSKVQIISGLFLMTIALNTRMGAYFTLPFIAMWAARLFRKNKIIFPSFLAICSGTILSGFLLYSISVITFSDTPRFPDVYYSRVFYNFTHGYDRSLSSVFNEYPELKSLPENEQTIRIFNLAFDNIREDPDSLLSGAIKQYQIFFSGSWYGAFSFIETSSPDIHTLINLALFGLCVLGLFSWFSYRNDPIYSLVISLVIGVLLSIPFVPPELYNRVRFYAVSIPVFALLPGLGLRWILSRSKLQNIINPTKNFTISHSTPILTIAIVLVTIIGPYLVNWFSSPTKYLNLSCDSGVKPILVKLNPGSFINILAENSENPEIFPSFKGSQFLRRLHDYTPHYSAVAEFEKIQPPTTIWVGLDLLSNQDFCIIAPTTEIQFSNGTSLICGNESRNNEVRADHFFYANSVVAINSP